MIFTVLAASGNSIGKVLQKQGTKGLPPLSLKIEVMRAYLSSPTWTLGFGLDILGALAMLKAVSEAPVSVVQPVSGCGLAILAVFSHFYLHETMNSLDWLGVALAGTGTIGVGMAGEEQKTSDLHILRFIWFIVWAILLFQLMAKSSSQADCCMRFLHTSYMGSLDWWACSPKGGFRPHEHVGPILTPSSAGHTDVIQEVVAGLEAGACFGMAAVVARVGFMLADHGHSRICVPAGILAGVFCSGGGFFCQTKGLKGGRAVVVSTCAAVSSIVTGVLVGMLALGEKLPISSFRRIFLFMGWLLIILGIVILMDSNRISLMLPRSIRRIMRLKPGAHKSNPPRLSQASRRESNPSTIVQLLTPPKASPAKERP